MINRIFAYTKNQHITIGQWMAGFTGIMVIRFILESLSSPPRSGVTPTDLPVIIHYVLFFIAVTVALMCVVRYFSKDDAGTIAKLSLFGLTVIWVSPLVDLVTTGGQGRFMAYLYADSLKEMMTNFVTFFGADISSGITLGLRVEIFFILLGIGTYVWVTRKKIVAVLGAVLTAYSVIFIAVSMPGILYLLGHAQNAGGPFFTETLYRFLERSITESNIAHNTLRGTLLFSSYERLFEWGLNKIMAQVFYLLSFGVIFGWFWSTQREKMKAVLKNSRPERIGFYLSLLFVGVGFAYLSQGRHFLTIWVDWMTVLTLMAALCSAWLYSVHMNDIADVGIDTVSNPERPLVKNILTHENMHQGAHVWLASALFGAFAAGYAPFFMIVVFISAYYIYSVPPLRLKFVPVLSSFLISLAILSAVLAGYFLVSPNKTLSSFPILLVAGIVVMFTLAVNVRDIKDIEGDRAEGVNTLPVLFKEHGVRIVGLLLGVSFLLSPIFLSFPLLYIIATPTAAIAYYLVIRKPYKELYIFILYFVFLSLASVLFALR